MRSLLVFLAGLIFLVPICSASRTLGTEAEPELSDAAGNVSYSPLYPGAHDHDYLDILALWFDFNETSDAIAAHLKVASTSKLGSPQSEVSIACHVAVNVVTGTEQNGILGFAVSIGAGSQEPTHRASYTTDGMGRDIEHTFSLHLNSPGSYEFDVPREKLQKLGERLTEPSAFCTESYRPSGAPISQISNGNDATGKGVYDFSGLKRPASNGTTEEPLPGNSKRPTVSSSEVGRSAGLPLPAVLMITIGLAIMRRRLKA